MHHVALVKSHAAKYIYILINYAVRFETAESRKHYMRETPHIDVEDRQTDRQRGIRTTCEHELTRVIRGLPHAPEYQTNIIQTNIIPPGQERKRERERMPELLFWAPECIHRNYNCMWSTNEAGRRLTRMRKRKVIMCIRDEFGGWGAVEILAKRMYRLIVYVHSRLYAWWYYRLMSVTFCTFCANT